MGACGQMNTRYRQAGARRVSSSALYSNVRRRLSVLSKATRCCAYYGSALSRARAVCLHCLPPLFPAPWMASPPIVVSLVILHPRSLNPTLPPHVGTDCPLGVCCLLTNPQKVCVKPRRHPSWSPTDPASQSLRPPLSVCALTYTACDTTYSTYPRCLLLSTISVNA